MANTKPTRGGARPGSGRKSILKNPVRPQPYIDKKTFDYYVEAGDGNFSLGLRRIAFAMQLLENTKDRRIPVEYAMTTAMTQVK